MNRKLVSFTMLIVLLLVIAGAVAAAPATVRTLSIAPNSNLDVTCPGGVLFAEVDNNSQPAVVHLTCYSHLPP